MGEGIGLHAFGVRVKSEEIVKEVFKLDGKGEVKGRNGSKLELSTEGLTIIAKPPDSW